jgi:hypothetical protein
MKHKRATKVVEEHVDDHRRGVAGVYNRAAYTGQKAEALAHGLTIFPRLLQE